MAQDKKYIPELRFPEFKNDGEWILETIGTIADTFSGGTPTVGNRKYYGGDIPFIRSGEISNDKTELFITESGLSNSSAKMVDKGTVLYAMYGATSGEVAISKISGAINQAILAIIPKSQEYNSSYIYHYLKHNKQYILGKYLQGGQGNLSANIINNLPICLPCDSEGKVSIKEQQKIADCLSSLDEYINVTKQKVDQLKEHKKGLMQCLFPANGKTTPEFRFPGCCDTKEWDNSSLGAIGDTFGGLSGKNSDDFGSGRPFVTYKQVFDFSEVSIKDCSLVRIVESESQNKLEYGDVLVTMSSETPEEIGYTSVVTDKDIPECYLNSFCFIYRIFDKDSFDPRFLIYLFNCDTYRSSVIRIAQGITRYNISKTQFKDIMLSYPKDKSEQRAIAEVLYSADIQINKYVQKVNELETQKKGLRQQLFPKL